MINILLKFYPIFFLIILDFISVVLSVYFSASFIQISFIPFLDLFYYYSCLFFFIVVIIYYSFKNYSYLNRSFGINNIKSLITGSILIFLSLYIIKIIFELIGLSLYFYDNYFLSIKNIFNQTLIFCLFSIVSRIVASKISIKLFLKNQTNSFLKDYILYGAGRSAQAFLEKVNLSSYKKPKYIIDDDSLKIGRFIHDIKIISFGEFEDIVIKNKTKIEKVVFCIPSIESIKVDKIKKKINDLGIKFETDSFDKSSKNDGILEILTSISDKSQNIKENINNEIKSFYANKVVLVTGGGGSIGKEICYKLSKFDIKKLIIVDIDEYRLSIVNRELRNNDSKFKDKYFDYLIDINNFNLLEDIFRTHKPDIVYHTAASKHVDLVEKNWFYASINNINTTYNVCECSKIYKIKKTIFISTDKAVEPINFLGLSKAVGETIVKQYVSETDHLNFSIVRFGNVVGSSGSLLDAIKHQLKISNEVKITDKKMTRYFMTISDAANLVLISTKISKNGDCHVLKMGNPVKIIDIIKSIVDQKNQNLRDEKPKIKIKVIGMRPGEKLHEKLYDETKIKKTENSYILNEDRQLLDKNYDVKNFIKEINSFQKDKNGFKKKLIEFIDY